MHDESIKENFRIVCERLQHLETKMIRLEARNAINDQLISEEWFTDEWLASIGFVDEGIKGMGRLISGGEGHPVELFLLGGDDGYTATLAQSDPTDLVTITGRRFKTRSDVLQLLHVLGG